MLEYLLYVRLLVIPCSAQPVNTPELLCLGFLPPSSLSQPLGRILPNANQVIQSLLKAITCPNHSRAKCLTTRDNPMSQRPLKLFKPANPKPAYLVLPVLSYRNHSKNSCLQFPIFLCLLTNPSASPCGPSVAWHALSSWKLYLTIFSMAIISQSQVLLYLKFPINTLSFKSVPG